MPFFEALDALGHVAHQLGDLAASEQQQSATISKQQNVLSTETHDGQFLFCSRMLRSNTFKRTIAELNQRAARRAAARKRHQAALQLRHDLAPSAGKTRPAAGLDRDAQLPLPLLQAPRCRRRGP
jgi:hypothetical protein